MRPQISDKTVDRLEDWMEENPEKGITSVKGAIEYLVDKGIKADEQALTEKEITERLEKLEDKVED